MSKSVIELKNITKVYNLYEKPSDRLKEALHPLRKSYHQRFYALNNISLKISHNQSIGIVGLNGSGKSTLLKIISGILTPTSGTMDLTGKVSALLELGAGFNPEFTGMENINFQCSLQGYDHREIKELLPGIIEFADIGDYIHQPVKTYSSGMYVRLAFAVAINVDPDILVVDEALAVGDAYFQTKCIKKIKKFLASRKTLLFVSHDPNAVKTLCDTAYLLHKGHLVDQGSPAKVFDYYNALIAEQSIAAKSHPEKEAVRERSGNKKMEILKVETCNIKGQFCETFFSGQTILISIELLAHQEILNPTIGILIKDRLGHDIFGINNHSMNQAIGMVQKGQTLKVSYKIPLNLGPNTYRLTTAAHSHNTHVQDSYDWINDALIFRVVHSKDLTFLGHCRLDPTFNFHKMSPAASREVQ